MALPPLVTSGQVVAASHINALRNFLPLMADGTTSTPGLRFEDDPDTGLHRPGSNQLAIVTGGAVRVTVRDTGAVVDGVLHVVHGANDVDALVVSGADDSQYVAVQSNATTGRIFHWNGTTWGNLALCHAGGSVGIGTASPSSALDVIGNVEISGSIAQDAWTAATLQNSWSDFGGGYPATQFRKDKQGYLYIIGTITGGTYTDGTVLFNLPSGFRPGGNRIFGARQAGTATEASILVEANGDVKVFYATTNTGLHLYATVVLT